MLGLMLILVYGVFLLVIPAVLGLFVWRWAIKRGKRRAWSWGMAAALAIPVWAFWDYYPTKWTHEYYCKKEAGFWIYKTYEQWKAENPGVLETLVENNNSTEGFSPNWPTEKMDDVRVASINQRFVMVYKDHLSSQNENSLFLHVWRWTTELVDKKNNEVLAKQIDFSSGNGYLGSSDAPVKFWLRNDHCIDNKKQSKQFDIFLKYFKGVKN